MTHPKPHLSDLLASISGKAVRDDAGVIHSLPFDDPQYPDASHAGIMLQAQRQAGATFDHFNSLQDRGWILKDGTFVRSGDVDEGPGAHDSTQASGTRILSP